MKKKPAKTPRVASLNVRWKDNDVKDNLPKRFSAACVANGFNMSDAVRVMIRGFTEELEKHGSTAIKVGIAAGHKTPKRK